MTIPFKVTTSYSAYRSPQQPNSHPPTSQRPGIICEFAILRRIALNLLKHDTTTKAGVKARRLKAGWDESYLLHLLQPLLP